MSLLETARKILPKGYQPTQEKMETDSLFQKMRLDCEQILTQHGTRVKNIKNRFMPFIYHPAFLFYKLTPWQTGDGIELTTELKDPENDRESLAISLMSPYISDPKKAPELILMAKEADTHLVILKDSAVVRDKNRTIRRANRKDAEVYQEIVEILQTNPQP